MLKLSLVEFFFRAIPEAFLFVLVGYAFDDKRINKRNLCIGAILLAILAYLVRMLPIHFGVHTILLIMIYVLITVSINKIDVIKSISAVLISSIILFILEWVNTFIVVTVFKINTESITKNIYFKLLIFSPSLLLFAIILMFLFYKNMYLRKVTQDVFSRKTIK